MDGLATAGERAERSDERRVSRRGLRPHPAQLLKAASEWITQLRWRRRCIVKVRRARRPESPSRPRPVHEEIESEARAASRATTPSCHRRRLQRSAQTHSSLSLRARTLRQSTRALLRPPAHPLSAGAVRESLACMRPRTSTGKAAPKIRRLQQAPRAHVEASHTAAQQQRK